VMHVANGDAFAARLREAGIEGDVLSWADMLSEGPLPHGLRGEEDWRLRARLLAEDYPLDADRYVRDAAERLKRLGEAAQREEIVLWFDEELFCQANACYLLDWLALEAPDAKVSLVAEPGAAPVGGLSELLAERELLSRERRTLARAFWNALGHPDPSGVPRLLRADLSAWPRLALGLRAHLARFPDASGLDAIEEELLRILARGPVELPELFATWQETPLGRACGFGDAQVEVALRRMGPLVEREGKRLVARPDAERPPRERWIGGCRLVPGAPGWRRAGDALRRA